MHESSKFPAGIGFVRGLCIALACMVAFYISLTPLRGGDFWLHASIGRTILLTGKIPETLVFPFTEIASEHFNAHEWLSAIVFSQMLDGLGKYNLTFASGILGVLVWGLLTRLAYPFASRNLAVAMACGFMGLLVENYRHVLRPELLSLICTGAFWILLEKYVQAPRWRLLASAGVVVALWANLHGSFPIAIVLSFLYTVAACVDRYAVTRKDGPVLHAGLPQLLGMNGVVLLASMATPFGLELLSFAFRFGTYSDVHAYIFEWWPTFSRDWVTYTWFWVIVAAWCLIGVSVITTRKSMRTVDWLIVLFFSALAAKAVRFPVYLSFLCAMYLPRMVLPWLRRREPLRSSYGLLAALLITVAVFSSEYGNPMGYRPLVDRDISKLSPQMEKILRDPARRGNVLNSMELGAELVYLAYPRLAPVIDCRIDSYGLDYYKFVGNAVFAPRYFHEFVDRYDVKYLFLTHVSFLGFQQLPYLQNGEWKVVYTDEYSSFLERVNPPVSAASH